MSALNSDQVTENDIVLYLADELSDDRRTQVEAWIREKRENKDVYLELKTVWETGKMIRHYNRIDETSARARLLRKMRFSRLKNVIYLYKQTAAVLLFPLIGAFIIYLSVVTSDSSGRLSMAAITQNEVNVALGLQLTVVLPDGTRVWLNSGSYFKYPGRFSGMTREVYLRGEGYFEIAENRNRPFIIKTDGTDIVATGTVVNVLAYPSDGLIEVSLIDGKVALNPSSKSNGMIAPIELISGEKVTIREDDSTYIRKPIDPEHVTSWTRGYLVFKNDPFDEIVRKLSRWYNTDIILVDKDLSSYSYSATFLDETLLQVLELLKYSAPIEYTYSSRKKLSDNTFSKRRVEIRLRRK